MENQTAAGFTYSEDKLYPALIKSTDDYIYVCNMKTGVFCYPPNMVEEFGLPGRVMADALDFWRLKIHPNDWDTFLEANMEIVSGKSESHSVEYRAMNKDGEWVWLRCRGNLERDSEGNPEVFAGIITNLGKKNKVDPLTGLFNKYGFEAKCTDNLEKWGSRETIFMKIDIDDFHRINRLYNLQFGDEVIRIIAQRIQSLLPVNTMLYRLDGDEFVIVIKDGGAQDACTLYEKLKSSFSRQQVFDNKKFYCTLSCGCVAIPKDTDNYEELCKYLDCAVEYAKKRGKNRMEFFTDELISHSERSIDLTEILRESMENGFEGFQMYYQPIVDREQNLAGAEALARFRCDKYGEISPVEFIPLLESSGLILEAGKWIFAEAASRCKKWLRMKPDFQMGINLSCLQLEDESQASYMKKVVSDLGLHPGNLVLEATESHLAANIGKFYETLRQIQEMGIYTSMDDFGTGYSSLGILKQAPFNIVKIDRTFVKGIKDSQFDYTFIKLVVELCHINGIGVCIEGVEEREELLTLHTIDLDYMQGFLFGRPIPPDEFERKFFNMQ